MTKRLFIAKPTTSFCKAYEELEKPRSVGSSLETIVETREFVKALRELRTPPENPEREIFESDMVKMFCEGLAKGTLESRTRFIIESCDEIGYTIAIRYTTTGGTEYGLIIDNRKDYHAFVIHQCEKTQQTCSMVNLAKQEKWYLKEFSSYENINSSRIYKEVKAKNLDACAPLTRTEEEKTQGGEVTEYGGIVEDSDVPF